MTDKELIGLIKKIFKEANKKRKKTLFFSRARLFIKLYYYLYYSVVNYIIYIYYIRVCIFCTPPRKKVCTPMHILHT